MKALVIAPQPFFSPRGTPFSIYYRTLVTAEQGVEIDLLTYGEGQDINIPGVRILRIPHFAFLGNVKIGPSILKLFLDTLLLVRTVTLLIRNRYNFVHAHEEAVFFCGLMKSLFRFKLVYDMHSSLPQQLTNFNFTTSKIIISLFKKLEDSCLHKSDVVITICPALADYVYELIGKNEKHFLVENSIFEDVNLANPEMTQSGEGTAESSMVNIPKNRPLIVYTGTLEEYQGIDILLQAFKLLPSKHANVVLLIVGGSADQVDLYRNMAGDLGLLDRCVFTGRGPQTEAKKFNALADVIVSPRSAGTNTPLKLYEQLASGIPLVATRIYSHTQVLTDEVAFLADPRAQEFAEALSSALSDKDLVLAKTTCARELYERNYSRAAYENKVRRMLEFLS